jgi:hypothetical protein
LDSRERYRREEWSGKKRTLSGPMQLTNAAARSLVSLLSKPMSKAPTSGAAESFLGGMLTIVLLLGVEIWVGRFVQEEARKFSEEEESGNFVGNERYYVCGV